MRTSSCWETKKRRILVLLLLEKVAWRMRGDLTCFGVATRLRNMRVPGTCHTGAASHRPASELGKVEDVSAPWGRVSCWSLFKIPNDSKSFRIPLKLCDPVERLVSSLWRTDLNQLLPDGRLYVTFRDSLQTDRCCPPFSHHTHSRAHVQLSLCYHQHNETGLSGR